MAKRMKSRAVQKLSQGDVAAHELKLDAIAYSRASSARQALRSPDAVNSTSGRR